MKQKLSRCLIAMLLCAISSTISLAQVSDFNTNQKSVKMIETPQIWKKQRVKVPAKENSVHSTSALSTSALEQMCNEGIQLVENGKSSEGIGLLRKAAEQGYAAAQYRLGVCYNNASSV